MSVRHIMEQITRVFWFPFKIKAPRTLKSGKRFISTLLAISKLEITYGLIALFPINDVIGAAFEALGEKGVIHLAKNHSCSECSKPYKRADGQIVPNAAPVKMVVLDGIVMGPTVS